MAQPFALKAERLLQQENCLIINYAFLKHKIAPQNVQNFVHLQVNITMCRKDGNSRKI